MKSVVPKLKDKVQLELVKQYGAHPEIRINGKKLSADYNSVESLEKSLTDALSKAAR